MKLYYTGHGWTDDYNNAVTFPLTEAVPILLNSRDCCDENSTMCGLFPDARGADHWLIIKLEDPDLV